tara:strand:+ start:145 stop:798 length:654 start_codon:yes stop_codon:yes gene_type:complete
MGKIYKVSAPNGKAYIGQTRKEVKQRFNQHCWHSSHGTAIHSAIMFYGRDNMKVETLVEVPDSLLDEYEIKMIDLYGTFGKWGYNSTRGGDINPMHDESVRKKCIATHAKAEVKARFTTKMQQVMQDKDVREKISKTLKKNLAAPEARAQRTNQLAACDQEKRKKNLSAALKRPDVKAKHVAALQRIAKDPVARAKKSASQKARWVRRKAGLPPLPK